MKHEPIDLMTIAKGAALELFTREYDRVLVDIDDPATEPKAKRVVTLTFTFEPDKERRHVVTTVEARVKLAGSKAGGSAFAAWNRDTGERILVDANPDQLGLDLERPKPEAATFGATSIEGTFPELDATDAEASAKLDDAE